MLFSGTLVASGNGVACVVTIGKIYYQIFKLIYIIYIKLISYNYTCQFNFK